MALLQRRRPGTPGSTTTKASKSSTGVTVVSSASPVNVGDRVEAERLTRTKQSWQQDAWVYAKNLGELGYARRYMGNSCMRLRLYVGTLLPAENTPIELSEASAGEHGLPPDLVAAAQQALDELTGGSQIGAAKVMKSLTENFQVAGEMYLFGFPNQTQTAITWEVHSVTETRVERDGRIGIQQVPGSNKDVQWVDPATTYVSRLWTPDPEWSQLADSPMRGIIDVCEELLLCGRDVRATIRSRLANNGVLLVPDGLTVLGADPEADDDESDPIMSEFFNAAEANLTNEGDASAAVPIGLRGPADVLKEFRHITFDRKQNQFNITQRAELISRIATSIDLPAEVLTGKVDLNHWTSWQVDDDTFRHHIEPTAIIEVDALTTGFLWRRLDAMNLWAPDLVHRIVIWYDPTDLVTHPDRTADALQLWDRNGISDEALRRVTGFTETDKPTDEEILIRIALRLRSLDPSIQGQILQGLDPNIEPPPPRAAPGGGGGGPTPGGKPLPQESGPPPAPDGSQAAARMHQRLEVARAVVAAVTSTGENERLARKLVDVDRRLRERVHTAANGAIRRALERAGARVVSKARTASAASVREAIRDVHPVLVAATLGRAVVASLGVTEEQLLDAEFTDLAAQWDEWVATGQRDALREVAKAAGVDMNAAFAQLDGTFRDDRAKGWTWLRGAMERSAQRVLSGVDVYTDADVATADFLSVGDVRAALALAGGFDGGSSSGLTDDGFPVDPSEMMGQVGTGDTIGGFLTENGFGVEGFEWVHGASANPFQPHLDLDGKRYVNFDDQVTSTGGGTFPPGGNYYPGDHTGCSCDFMPVIVQVAEAQAA